MDGPLFLSVDKLISVYHFCLLCVFGEIWTYHGGLKLWHSGFQTNVNVFQEAGNGHMLYVQ